MARMRKRRGGETMRVAITENTEVSHHGQVGVALHEAGARVDVFKAHQGGALPEAGDGYDALVVLGGNSPHSTMQITPICKRSAR